MEFSTGEWRAITDRTFIARCEPAGVNVGLVVGDEHVLMIDAGSHPDQGRELARSASVLTGRRVDQLVVTHWHWDHWFGAAGVGADIIVGHESLSELCQDEAVLADAVERGVAPEALVAPTEPMVLAKALDLGGVRVEILHFGPAHTASDLVVLVPSENVIFVGDLVEEGAEPQTGHDSRLENWPRVLDGALDTSNEATVFVPGHGEPVERMFVIRQRADLATRASTPLRQLPVV